MTDDIAGINFDDLSLTEQDAYGLSESAVRIDQARQKQDMDELAPALDRNMELWVGIRTLVQRPDSVIPDEVSDNLTKLANFVAQTTMDKGAEMGTETLDSLININLQISEGLLEGAGKR